MKKLGGVPKNTGAQSFLFFSHTELGPFFDHLIGSSVFLLLELIEHVCLFRVF